MSKLDKLKTKLNIDDKFTKSIKKEKKKTKISDVITLLEGYNYMSDILFLPTTTDGFKYCLVITDLATHEFDIEPMKSKTAKEVLNAMKKIFSRNYVKKPKSSIRTDNGTEFKGIVDEYLEDNNIFHSTTMPYRHSQLSMVESLNRTLGMLFNGYMNAKEEELGETYKEWTDVIDVIRTELNKIRYTNPPYTEDTIFNFKDQSVDLKKEPKFKIGELVHYKLSYPIDALGKPQPTSHFRTGDYRWSSVAKKIIKILYYSGAVPYRYMLDDMPYVSFTEAQLMKSDETDVKYIVKKIIGKKTEKKKIYYLVWWKGYKKAESTWEPKTELIKDNLKDYIDEFEKK